MDYTITCGGDPEDVCLTARGAASLVDLDAMFEEAVSDRRWVEGMKVLLDYTRLDMTTLSTDQMRARAGRLVEMLEAIGRQRIAVATSPASRRTIRMIGTAPASSHTRAFDRALASTGWRTHERANDPGW
ncbi:MAG TPA: hypothetical protein VGH82_16525 [Gaiellaceae bacterium]|jgi:hypothetical protein